MDTLGYYLVTRQDFQSDYQETTAWYLRRREERYQTIIPFVEDRRSITLDATSWQPSSLMQYLDLNPCVGDTIMRSVEPNTGGCAVVLNILEDVFGDRVYHLQTTLGLTTLKGPEQLTQAQLDRTTYHPTSRENFLEAFRGYFDWYQDRLNELYQVIRPFVEDSNGMLAD